MPPINRTPSGPPVFGRTPLFESLTLALAGETATLAGLGGVTWVTAGLT